MPRNPETSLQAYDRICRPGARETTYLKIIKALEKIVEGNYEAIAKQAEEKESRIWKRLGELRSMGIIIDTGKRTLTKDNNNSMVYSLFQNSGNYENIKAPERIEKTTVADYASLLVNSTAAGKKLIQAQMFEETK